MQHGRYLGLQRNTRVLTVLGMPMRDSDHGVVVVQHEVTATEREQLSASKSRRERQQVHHGPRLAGDAASYRLLPSCFDEPTLFVRGKRAPTTVAITLGLVELD